MQKSDELYVKITEMEEVEDFGTHMVDCKDLLSQIKVMFQQMDQSGSLTLILGAKYQYLEGCLNYYWRIAEHGLGNFGSSLFLLFYFADKQVLSDIKELQKDYNLVFDFYDFFHLKIATTFFLNNSFLDYLDKNLFRFISSSNTPIAEYESFTPETNIQDLFLLMHDNLIMILNIMRKKKFSKLEDIEIVIQILRKTNLWINREVDYYSFDILWADILVENNSFEEAIKIYEERLGTAISSGIDFKEALTIAKEKLDDTISYEIKFKLLIKLGIAYWKNLNLKEATLTLEQAFVQISSQEGVFQDEELQLLHTNGIDALFEIYMIQGMFSKALGVLHNLLQYSTNNPIILAEGLYRRGYIYRVRGWYDHAVVHYEKAMISSEKIDLKRLIAVLYREMGIINRYKMKYSEAIEYFEKSISTDPFDAHKAYYNKILTLLDLDDVISANETYTELELYEQERNLDSDYRKLSKAILLRSEKRLQPLAHAQEILIKMLDPKKYPDHMLS